MSASKLIPGSQLWHRDYTQCEEKDMLIVWYYANDPHDQLPRKQLTFKHLAAIKKASLIQENHQNDDVKINPQDFEKDVLKLIDLIQHVNYYDREYSKLVFGMKIIGNEKQRKEYVLDSLKEIHPSATINHLNNGYSLASFLETLKGGLILEEQYLERLKDQFQLVPDYIREEFELQLL